MLADCYAGILSPGDEVIIAETAHEANAGPWASLGGQGMTVKVWKMDPTTGVCALDDLDRMLTSRTRIVAFPHVSNLLGDIVDLEGIVRLAHRVGARVVVDGVAYAPHRAMDVESWDVDWYVYSTYKVYGPHMAALYGKDEAFAELAGPNHYFIPDDEVPYKFELGGVIHEGCAGLLALGDYLSFLAGRHQVDRQTVTGAFEVMTRCELPLQQCLLDYLLPHPRVRVVGPHTAGRSRVGTISFLHDELSSREIAEAAHQRNIGIRNGHMYAHRLCRAMGLDPEDGVVRVSLVHYNSLEEIHRLIDVFDGVL
jgi:selenocysteine lyase/cysteine desulfurase